MVFKPGESGNPDGRKPQKEFAAALRLAINADDESGVKKLRKIAERLVAEAMAGESWAIQQVADRLDGKPAQAIENANGEGFELIHTIRRIIVDTGHPDSASVPAAPEPGEI